MPYPRIIGLSGKKGAGKDTAGAYFAEKYGYKKVSFAAPLKASAAALFDIDPADWEVYKNDPDVSVRIVRELRGREHAGPTGPTDRNMSIDVASLTAREFLQRYGTEAHRDIFGADFWTKQLMENLAREMAAYWNDHYVITDARFINECTAVRKAGGVIVVIERPDLDEGDGHASEAPLPDDLVDTVIHNRGSIEDLHRVIDIYMQIAKEIT